MPKANVRQKNREQVEASTSTKTNGEKEDEGLIILETIGETETK